MSTRHGNLIKHWREQADRHEEMAARFRETKDDNRADTHQLIANTFRICADSLQKI